MRGPSTIFIAGLVAAVATVTAAAGLYSLSTGVGPAGFGFSDGYDGAAYRLLVRDPGAAELTQANALARKALTVSPYDNTSRLRLAYIDTLEHGRLTEEAEAHLRLSYELIPIDEDVAAWRIKFALEHWTALTPRTRTSVQYEVEAFDQLSGRAIDTRAILSSISDPSGRLAAALWLHGLETKTSSESAIMR